MLHMRLCRSFTNDDMPIQNRGTIACISLTICNGENCNPANKFAIPFWIDGKTHLDVPERSDISQFPKLPIVISHNLPGWPERRNNKNIFIGTKTGTSVLKILQWENSILWTDGKSHSLQSASGCMSG